jgi:hypothetical protein
VVVGGKFFGGFGFTKQSKALECIQLVAAFATSAI